MCQKHEYLTEIYKLMNFKQISGFILGIKITKGTTISNILGGEKTNFLIHLLVENCTEHLEDKLALTN
jgi:hypothetical protein